MWWSTEAVPAREGCRGMRRLALLPLLVCAVAWLPGTAALGAKPRAAIAIDYPQQGSIFPPELPAPMFIWRDSAPDATAWRVEIKFSKGNKISLDINAEPFTFGEIDERCVSDTNELPKPTPQQAASKTWRPGAETWAEIQRRAVESDAVITITGLRGGKSAVSEGSVTIRTSKDPVGAPIFYRDVPLMPSELKKGVIKPLAPAALPLIAWRLKDIRERKSKLLLTGIHTCANCHSFSADGKTLGMDMDGPANDKGLYALAEIKPQMSIGTGDMISWDPTRIMAPTQARVGFLSQLSPDGKNVLTTVHMTPTMTNYYVANFKDYRFLQVFYPTRGILAWYNRETRLRKPLPGADDERYVQTDGVWTPDGKTIIFARAEAKDPYPADGKMAEYANDPLETQIKYDLYRIPFNNGEGGTPEPIAGASNNGMSNTFPRVSPDGRWIVFVKCKNGQLMRPDGELYMVPIGGGEARRMNCNLPTMNSWHSFSPNGKWMVFSSKSRSYYTQMYLTHIDENGNDSPAILIEGATAANRAVNLPEFVNIPYDGLNKIDVPAIAFYEQFDRAWNLTEAKKYAESIPEWEKAVELNPDDAKAHTNLGMALVETGRIQEGVEHYRKANQLDPNSPDPYDQLGVVLARSGRYQEAIPYFQQALRLNPEDATALTNLSGALALTGTRLDEAVRYGEKLLANNPDSPQVYVNLAIALTKLGRFDEAIQHLQKAAELSPDNASIQNNLGAALAQRGRINEAIPHFEQALKIAPDFAEGHYNMGVLYAYVGRTAEAVNEWRTLLKLNPDHAAGLNRLAQVLASSPDASLRSGAEAVQLAAHAVQLTGGNDAAMLDTLAAAYAEAGRFADAVSTAKRALDAANAAGNSALAASITAKMGSYEAGKAWHGAGAGE